MYFRHLGAGKVTTVIQIMSCNYAAVHVCEKNMFILCVLAIPPLSALKQES